MKKTNSAIALPSAVIWHTLRSTMNRYLRLSAYKNSGTAVGNVLVVFTFVIILQAVEFASVIFQVDTFWHRVCKAVGCASYLSLTYFLTVGN